jgi:hypothetical protein
MASLRAIQEDAEEVRIGRKCAARIEELRGLGRSQSILEVKCRGLCGSV